MKEEFCIMPSNPPYWYNKRFNGSERHEVWEGRVGNRDKSIEDGLVIFTTPQLHRLDKDFSIHLQNCYFNPTITNSFSFKPNCKSKITKLIIKK